jgi:hypothetical protein
LDGAADGLLGGVAVAGEGLFDAVGGQLTDDGAVAIGDQEDYAAGVAHEDGGARVGVVAIELLDGAVCGMMLGEDGLEFAFEFDEAIGE